MTRKNSLGKGWLLDRFSGRLFFYDEIDSTMTEAKRLANKQGLTDGILLLAEVQTGGKGRRGRVWHSEKGGIWLSYIVSPRLSREYYTLYPIMTAVALFKCLEKFNVSSKIKWPNDIVVDNKKMAGIAIDLISKDNDKLVIGLGINVYNKTIDIATKVSDYNKGIKIDQFFASVVEHLDKYKEILEEDKQEIIDLWKESNNVLGNEVKIIPADGSDSYYAIAVDISKNGALIIENEGIRKSVVAADVSLRIR